MAEDPIKLFATRAERYPQPTEADIAQGAARAALAAIPVIGGPITEVLSLVLAPAVARRRDEWLKELADALETIEAKVNGFCIEDLQQNEAFVSAVIQATRTALSTHQREKLEALRNAVLNVVLSKSLSEEKQIFFLGLIDIFTVTHLEILKLFENRAVFPASRMTELGTRRELTDPMVIDLKDRGMLVDPRPFIARTRESEGSLVSRNWTVSPLGRDLLSFISVPKELK